MSLASDDFQRGDGGLGANWTTAVNFDVPVIVSGAVRSNSVGDNAAARYSAITWPDDQYSEIIVGHAGANGTSCSAFCRMPLTGSDRTCYQVGVNVVGTYLAKYVQSTWTQMGTVGPAVSDGDAVRLTVVGVTVTVTINGGAPVCGSPIVDTGTLITSGAAGCGADSADPTVAYWEGGVPVSAFLLQNLERGRAIERGFMRGMMKLASGLFVPAYILGRSPLLLRGV